MAVYSYTATKNTALKSSAPNTNFSADTQNRTYINYDTEVYEAVAFGFDVDFGSAALLNKKLNSAALEVYVVSKAGSANSYSINRIDGAWAENTVTYNNLPGGIDYFDHGGYAGYVYQLTAGAVNSVCGYTGIPATLISYLEYGFWLALNNESHLGETPSIMVQTRRGATPPVLKIDVSDAPLSIANMLPGGGYVYAGAAKVFSWTATNPYPLYTFGTVTQASAKLRYRKVGVTPYTEISIPGATNSYTMPAGTFDGASTYEWQVAVTSNDGIVTTSSWISFSTTDATPSTPELLAPVNEYVDTDSTIVFEWQHVIGSGTQQSKADLQYSYEGGAWTDFATVTGSAQTYSAAAGTFTAGKLRWRARTYNTDNVAGDWSDPAAFIGVGAPAAPNIVSVSAASRPTTLWQSTGQAGYQLQLTQGGVTLHDTGETAGTGKTYTLPFYLPNGAYTVAVRVINSSLLWSAWATLDFTLAVTPPAAPVITGVAITNGTRITVSGGSSAAHLYLLRDGIPVAEITGQTSYDDYAGIGSTEYVVRAVDANENYADSNAAWVTVTVEAAALAAVDALGTVITMNKKASGQAPVTGQIKYGAKGVHYVGREQPVYTISEFVDESYSVAYYYTTVNEWLALRALLDRRKTLLYRDMLGNRIYCAGTAVSITQDHSRVLFALSLSRVDYVEEIDYAEVTEA